MIDDGKILSAIDSLTTPGIKSRKDLDRLKLFKKDAETSMIYLKNQIFTEDYIRTFKSRIFTENLAKNNVDFCFEMALEKEKTNPDKYKEISHVYNQYKMQERIYKKCNNFLKIYSKN